MVKGGAEIKSYQKYYELKSEMGAYLFTAKSYMMLGYLIRNEGTLWIKSLIVGSFGR